MSEDTNNIWSSYESIRNESDYNTRMKLASEIKAVIDRSTERGLNGHFISGLELAHGIVLGLARNHQSEPQLDTDTLF